MSNDLSKRVGAWMVMDVLTVESSAAGFLTRLIGPIVQSNFLEECEQSEMPIVTEALGDKITIGDRVKMVFFTTKGELEAYNNDSSMGFRDDGFRYFKWVDEGWDFIYEG